MKKFANIIEDEISPGINYRAEAFSDIGGRKEQQDSAYVLMGENSIFAVVCDGMGGENCGAIASKTAVDTFRKMISNGFGSSSNITDLLKNTMKSASMDVRETVRGKPGGTTAVAIYISDGELFWASVGDSRLYISRGKEFLQVTRDHNYKLQQEEISSAIGESAEYDSEKSEMLISFLGKSELTLMDLTQNGLKLLKGDRLLLATDGLYRLVSDDKLAKIIKNTPETAECVNKLADKWSKEALDIESDNITFILIDIL